MLHQELSEALRLLAANSWLTMQELEELVRYNPPPARERSALRGPSPDWMPPTGATFTIEEEREKPSWHCGACMTLTTDEGHLVKEGGGYGIYVCDSCWEQVFEPGL